MVCRFAFAVAGLLAWSGPVRAQSPSPSPPPPLKPVAPQAGSLAQLLDNGWTIQSINGQNGQFLVLQLNGRKWVRCELLAPTSTRLRYTADLISDCRALN